MATNTFREFVQEQLCEFEKQLRGSQQQHTASMIEERLQGAREFARFLFGESIQL